MTIARRHFDRAIVLLSILVLWQVMSYFYGSYWVGAPWETLIRFGAGLSDGVLLRHSGYTLLGAVFGFLIGGIPAVILPFLLRRLPSLVRMLDPYMVGGYGVPKLALAPLFILWFGIGIESKIVLVATAVFFIVYFSTLSGVRALDPKLVRMAQVIGASERVIATEIIFPGAVPYIFAGLRTSAPYAIGAAVVAEMISSNRGLGYLIQSAAMDFDTIGLFVSLFAITLLVLVVNWAMATIEARLMRWRPIGEISTEAGI